MKLTEDQLAFLRREFASMIHESWDPVIATLRRDASEAGLTLPEGPFAELPRTIVELMVGAYRAGYESAGRQ